MNPGDFEAAWRRGTMEEDFWFEAFPEQPVRLRRSSTFPGALAGLTFGGYRDLDGDWVDEPRAIWLDMIVSDRAGHGSALLKNIGNAAMRNDFAIVGEPVPLKPLHWASGRHFDRSPANLIAWYLRQDFKVIQNGSATRVVQTPLTKNLDVKFLLNM